MKTFCHHTDRRWPKREAEQREMILPQRLLKIRVQPRQDTQLKWRGRVNKRVIK
jgi:hypothetical protein